MSAMLEVELGTIALCWRLRRRDGICVGFTTHDRDLLRNGLVYRSAPGMLPSAITRSAGFDPDMVDVQGALTSGAITRDDLAAGRWDDAEVAIFMIDWTGPDAATLPLARGRLGDVTAIGDAFTAELNGPAAALDRPVVEQTSPECRASLGDARCRIDMASRVRMTRIAAVVEEGIVDVSEAADEPNAYGYGRLRWISGANSGLESEIRGSSGVRLTLREPPPFAIASGDRIEISEGCDKAFATCRERFGNAANFRGEPHLPGMDLLTRYGSG